VARHKNSDSVQLHIAGIHAIGSLGAANYIADNLTDLYTASRGTSVSMIVRSSSDGLIITDAELVGGPWTW
jgi:hypothetical protein